MQRGQLRLTAVSSFTALPPYTPITTQHKKPQKPASKDPAASDADEAAAAADGHPSWQQMSTACHDCQYQHVKFECKDVRHTRAATYCSR